jgi:DNA replication protein DnaC
VYGENRYPLESVIVRRYRNLLTTIIASNLTLDQIEHRYGTRMFDRLMEMYDRIVYRGPSYRRQAK